MNIVQLTPGAGRMYCGNCLRDNALVAELRRMGHEALMLPLYLPLTLDEADESADKPVFFSGINVYLDQKSSWFRSAPKWLHRLLTSRLLLKIASRGAAKTRPGELGEMTLSMLQGEEGNQARELEDLVQWFKLFFITPPQFDRVIINWLTHLCRARSFHSSFCFIEGKTVFIPRKAAKIK